MDKGMEAAALAGWASNPSVNARERMQAASSALDHYVKKDEQLRELLSYVRMESEAPSFSNPAEGLAVVGDRLAAILDGEQ